MDEDLIKLVNKLQDTFSNLGARPRLLRHRLSLLNIDSVPHDAWPLQVGSWTCPSWLWYAGFVSGGYIFRPLFVSIRRLAANLQANPVYSKSK
jgi:hypothetical protein